MQVGDVIEVKNKADAVKKSVELAKQGIETDFLYVYKRRTGLWLEVIKVSQ